MDLQWKSISSSFSTDLTSEILLRLPEKSIVRFRCVSKLWLSITTDPYFIKMFETWNPRPRLLLCFKEGDELVVSSIPQHNLTLDQNWRKSYSFPKPTRMKFPEFTDCFSLTASVHGLICFPESNKAIVWNPSTRKFITLPEPGWKSNITVFLGYDAVQGKHKVIAVPSRKTTCRVCRVITLGSAQESWRIVKTNQNFATSLFDGFGQCIKGVIYFLASTNMIYPFVKLIMRFDVKYEKLDVIQIPSDIRVDMLITYEGRLACVHKQAFTKKNGITMSILEDVEENKWSIKDFLAPYTAHDPKSQTDFRLKGFTHAGEFIYKPYDTHVYHKSLYALFFDPVRNSFRRFGFKGIADDEERLYQLHVFPNHFETQMSF